MESDNLREKLQSRTITPTSNSWDKLNEKLTVEEDEESSKKWLFLKYAAILLILVSVGFFFFQPKEEIKNNPIIVSPTLKKDIIKLPEINSEPKIEVATTPKITPKKESIKKETILESKNQIILENEAIALVEEPVKDVEFVKKEELIQENFGKKERFVVAENTEIEVPKTIENIDLEIEQLLRKATIKNKINNLKNSNKRTISASDLLFQVEEDLDKDLKQKLFDKIVRTLKNPKQVVTDAGN